MPPPMSPASEMVWRGDNGSFGCVGRRKNEIGDPLFARKDSNRQHAGDGTYASFEARLADEKELVDIVDA